MIVLKADSELKMTFERLIKTMHANVNWTGLFVALDNYLILQGEVRSLFFHFDSRKVAENIVDLPIKEDEIKDTDEAAVRDVINMILYAFGKWGTIQGLRVEKNTEQLNTLFGHVLAGIYIEPEYTTQYFRFYHAGKRITYEDVIQAALEAKEAVQKEEEADEEQGLWHKVEWKMAHTVFERTELSLSERAKGRIGNNFYKVGYRCPKCKGNLHMIMYPKGKEFRIETPEGVVLLAKACTCAACHRFYTPRPWKLLGDGDIYLMDFEEDKKAYEDYLELMGRNGEHEANSRYNEYEDGRKPAGVEDEQQPLEELCEDLPEYSDYGDNADRMRSIGQVFPVIFFLVAALVSLTTMTRMVEEQRTQIGTMKALGYGKYAIASKYLLYAFLATVGGSILGILIGEKILPWVIINGYGIMYKGMMNNIQIRYEFKFAMIAAGAATVCTVGATIFSCYRALAETPASLMRPPAPKEGKRILLERIPLFWKHLNFTWKSTLRNLFRYKKRFFMTIFGISGSMALMLVGFGLRDSIMDIARRQYQELQHYTGTIIDDEDATDKERQELDEFLKNDSQIERYTHVQFTKMSVPRNKSNISVYVYVPENLETFNKDVTLQDRKTKEKYKLTEAGTVISEKTATLTGLKVGDTMTITKDGKNYETKIAAVTENYMGHYIYMTGNVYEQTFGEKPNYSATVFTVKEEYKESESEVGNEILKHPAALSISYTSSLEAQLHRMLGALDTVIIVLIISAGMLAFVVLYNLNNVNITERQRELATLKVLGFYDTEVSAYVYRENVILTFIGVLAGAVFGIFLHRYIIRTVEVDAVMFGRNINPVSFLYCGLLTIGFSMIVNLFMHQKLKKIDMVESLKSVE